MEPLRYKNLGKECDTMQYTLYQWMLFFFSYGFLGWVWECLYVSAYRKKWVNRGFLYGPLIPMYGFGTVLVLWVTVPVRGSIPWVFLLGMTGITVLEYGTGTAMQKLFHARYWDYSRNRFNVNGYICPFCSFGWGLFSIIQIQFLHFVLESTVLKIPAAAAGIISMIFVAVYAADTALSVQSALYLRKKQEEGQTN